MLRLKGVPKTVTWVAFTVPIYYVSVALFVTDNDLKSEMTAAGFAADDANVALNTAGATIWGIGQCENIVVRFRKNSTIDVIAHEVFHLTHRIMERNLVKFDISNHEAFALLNGWLMNAILSLLQGYAVDAVSLDLLSRDEYLTRTYGDTL